LLEQLEHLARAVKGVPETNRQRRPKERTLGADATLISVEEPR
jgi:hypothetical protein